MKTTHPTAHHPDYSQSALQELEALNAQLTSERDDAVAERDEFKQRYYQVLEALRLARHQRFGKSSEIDTGQSELFDIEEDSIELDSSAPQTSETSKTRRQPKR
ncbi:transposase domain-containing protein [Vibrio pectenicida]